MSVLKRIYLQLKSIIKIFGSSFFGLLKLANLRYKWTLINSNNNTFPVNVFPIDLVSIGDHSYGPIDVYTYYAEGEGLVIGKYCSIAKDVKFILGGNHRTDCLMTFPTIHKFINENENEALTKGKIVLEDDVWIGVGSILLSGVRLGQGCVVAAGSVVTKSFPPYSIIGGNPSKIIKMRFEDDVVEKLKLSGLRLNSIKPEQIIRNKHLFTNSLNEKIAEDLISLLKK